MTLCNMLISIQNIFHMERWNQDSRYCNNFIWNAFFFLCTFTCCTVICRNPWNLVWLWSDFAINKIAKDCFTTCLEWTSVFKKYPYYNDQGFLLLLFLAGYSGRYWRWTVLWRIGAFKINRTKTCRDTQGSFTCVNFDVVAVKMCGEEETFKMVMLIEVLNSGT